MKTVKIKFKPLFIVFLLIVSVSYIKPYREGYYCVYRTENVVIWESVNIPDSVKKRIEKNQFDQYYTAWKESERINDCKKLIK